MGLTRPPLVISAPAKSSGKSTVTLGLARAWVDQGCQVQCFKKGPDFIDPMWHSLATGRPGRNLDSWMMPLAAWQGSLAKHSLGMDVTLLEGNHGLHDGLDLQGRHSTAGMASQLNAPVLLVVDGSGLNRAVAALVLGQMEMEPKTNLIGVVLNQIRSSRQAEKQVKAIGHYTGLPVFGVLPKLEEVGLTMRHLGLSTPLETAQGEQVIKAQAALMTKEIDLDPIRVQVAQAPGLSIPIPGQTAWKGGKFPVGVFRGPAFCFYYPENLEALEQAGAELIDLDPTQDMSLPELQGLYIGGGFPEHFLESLSGNRSFINLLRAKLEAGLPYWAECGGLIYLSESACFDQGQEYPLVGWLPGQVHFSKRPVGYGYMETEAQGDCWFTGKHAAHEFHYSKFTANRPVDCGFLVKRGYGLGESQDGLLVGAGVAGYAHIHSLSSPDWAPGFMQQVKQFAGK